MTDSVKALQKEIRRLAQERNAVILSHNYQIAAIQEIADYLGDSFGLSRQAQQVDEEIIIFCGVDFMAEIAAILNPQKTVLLPDPKARCPMAAQLSAQQVREAKARHPGIPVVLYVNTTAEAKAEADVTCTSSNLCQIINQLDGDTVILGPDANLAYYAQKTCNKRIIPVPEQGFCHVHVTYSFAPELPQLLWEKPDALFLVHPECGPAIQDLADFIGSTGQMIRYARESPADTFIIATEVDLVTRLRREIPGKTFIPALSHARCKAMKKITLEKVKASLENNQYRVTVPEPIAQRARRALQRMLDLT
ncbi:MAG: quinolinate synthase NadA [Promethearchaeota archaeon]